MGIPATFIRSLPLPEEYFLMTRNTKGQVVMGLLVVLVILIIWYLLPKGHATVTIKYPDVRTDTDLYHIT